MIRGDARRARRGTPSRDRRRGRCASPSSFRTGGRSVPSSSGVRADGVGGARRRARGPVDDRCAQEERSRCLACATADARASAKCDVRRWGVRTSAGGRSTWQVSRRLRPRPTARASTRNRHLAALVRYQGALCVLEALGLTPWSARRFRRDDDGPTAELRDARARGGSRGARGCCPSEPSAEVQRHRRLHVG